MRRLIELTGYPGRLSIDHNHDVRDTAARACRKRWEHCGREGASKFQTVRSEIDTLSDRCAEKVSYRRWLAALLATWRPDGVSPAVPDVAYSFRDDYWSQLGPVVKRWYQAREQHFETRRRMLQNSLLGWCNVQIVSIMLADFGGVYPISLFWWGEYEFFYLLFVPTLLVLSYYRCLFLCGSSDDISRVITLAISELVIRFGVHFSVYAANWAAPDNHVESLRFDHVRGRYVILVADPVLQCPQSLWVLQDFREDEHGSRTCCFSVSACYRG